jgi:hypothetical protein
MVTTSPDKAAAPEISLGHDGLVGGSAFLEALPAHIAQQRVDALMIALDARTRPVQLQEARHDLKRQ